MNAAPETGVIPPEEEAPAKKEEAPVTQPAFDIASWLGVWLDSDSRSDERRHLLKIYYKDKYEEKFWKHVKDSPREYVWEDGNKLMKESKPPTPDIHKELNELLYFWCQHTSGLEKAWDKGAGWGVWLNDEQRKKLNNLMPNMGWEDAFEAHMQKSSMQPDERLFWPAQCHLLRKFDPNYNTWMDGKISEFIDNKS